MHARYMHYQLSNHSLCRIIRAEEVDLVCYIGRKGHYKNCIVLLTGSMIHRFPIEEATHQSVFTTAEESLGITIDLAKLQANGLDCEILYKKERPINFWLSRQHLSAGEDISIRHGMKRERLDWRRSYQKLKQKRGFQQKYSDRQSPFLVLERCNILGIELDRLSIFQNRQAPNYPINNYRAELWGDGTSKTYFDLKKWLVDLGAQLLEAHERETHYFCQFNFQDIVIKLVYPARSFECYRSSGVTFTLTNERAYPDLLQLRPFEKDMQVDQFIELPEIKLPHSYRQLEIVRNLPPVILDQYRDQCILWIDRSKQLIGLSDRTFANIIRVEKIEGFFIQNVAPARGSGWSQFGVVHRQCGEINLIGGAFQQLDFLQSFIEEELQLPCENRKGWQDT
ncbi:MAG: hypothetical protein KTR30_17465 [Saprospiraceae bacterium]|nr:hypothetical protein [Saprospiraceae bacterium]